VVGADGSRRGTGAGRPVLGDRLAGWPGGGPLHPRPPGDRRRTAGTGPGDPYAVAATTLNARANQVTVTTCHRDLLDGDGGNAEVVLAGDVFYHQALAQRIWSFLRRITARGAHVLIGDPGRAYLPRTDLVTLANYPALPDHATTVRRGQVLFRTCHTASRMFRGFYLVTRDDLPPGIQACRAAHAT
jgi:hypothetical protein